MSMPSPSTRTGTSGWAKGAGSTNGPRVKKNQAQKKKDRERIMSKETLIIGSRGSRLALWQAEWVQDQLQKKGIGSEIKKIKTTGDKILDVPLAMVGGKGLFVKEIEEALMKGEVDLAVHSMKDVPSRLPDPLHLAAIPRREAPRAAVIGRKGARLADLPSGAAVGP